MKKNLKFLLAGLCFSVVFVGCDTAKEESSKQESSSVVESSSSSESSSEAKEKKQISVAIEDCENNEVTKTYTGEAIAINYQSTDNVTLQVLYKGVEGTTYASSAQAPVNAGNYEVTLSRAEDESYKAYSAALNLVIEKAPNDFDFEVADVKQGETITPVVKTNASKGQVTYVYKGAGNTTYEQSENAPTEVGEYTCTATCASTENYNGSRKSVQFAITERDPLLSDFPSNLMTEVADLEPITYTLANQSYNTNLEDNMFTTSEGILVADNSNLGLVFEENYGVYLLVHSSEEVYAYFRTSITDAVTYENVVNADKTYCKHFNEVKLSVGYQVVALKFGKTAGFEGKDTDPVKGMHVLFSGNTKIKLFGMYQMVNEQQGEKFEDVPEALRTQVAGYTKLDVTVDGPSWDTNKTITVLENGIITTTGENLAVNFTVPEKYYMLVKSSAESAGYFRYGTATTYETVVNQDTTYLTHWNELTIAEGYQLIELVPEKTAKCIDAVPVGFHLLLGNRTNTNLVVYGFYKEAGTKDITASQPQEEGIPSSITSAIENKDQLSLTKAADSWATNGTDVVVGEDGSYTRNSNSIALQFEVPAKYYMVVKASEAVTGYFRYGTAITYETVVNENATYMTHWNEIAIPAGYSLLEITPEKKTAEGTPIGFHLMFNKAAEVTIYGIYKDAEETPETVPAEILAQVEEKELIEVAKGAASWATNGDGVTFGEDGVITRTSGNVALTFEVAEKMYLVVKADKAVSLYIRYGTAVTYETIVNQDTTYMTHWNEKGLVEGYQVITLEPEKKTAEGTPIGAHIMFNSDDAVVKFYGLYKDGAPEVDTVPAEILAQVEGKDEITVGLAAGSWDTNGAGVTASEDGITRTSGAVALTFEVTEKMYLVVKADKAVSLYIRYGTSLSYADVVNVPDTYMTHWNEKGLVEGYQVIVLEPEKKTAEGTPVGAHIIFNSADAVVKFVGLYKDKAE